MPRNAVTIGFSVPPRIAEKVERIAREEGRTKSELFREMLRVYEAQRELTIFEDLAAYGRAKAAKRGIRTEEDVARLVEEVRRGAPGTGH